jgi:CMP-N-acetylneuraminic acid synthetase
VSSSEGPERRPIIPARQARQGVTGHNVRRVLGFSLAAVVIVFAIIWIVYFA